MISYDSFIDTLYNLKLIDPPTRLPFSLNRPSNQDELNAYLQSNGITTSLEWTDYIQKYNSIFMNRQIVKLKMKRNMLLKNTDWILTYDNVQTLANLDDWVKYRQTLRDLFSNTTDISLITFPTEPPILRKPLS